MTWSNREGATIVELSLLLWCDCTASVRATQVFEGDEALIRHALQTCISLPNTPTELQKVPAPYKLAASARGYTPSGAAFPVTGVNNIVAGVRRPMSAAVASSPACGAATRGCQGLH